MRNIIKYALLFGVSLIMLSACNTSKKTQSEPCRLPRDLAAVSKGVEKLSSKESKRVLESVASQYYPWSEVMLEGKMSMKGLPIDPTAKVYMKYGKEILISVRAPIVGEVARLEIADDQIVIANRMKKVYVQEPLAEVLSAVNMSLTDVQDMLLGRVFILGQGTLSDANASEMEVSSAVSDCFIITPRKQPAQAHYGFTVTQGYEMQVLFAESADGKYQAEAEYNWLNQNGKKDVYLTIKADDKLYNPSFSFDAPNFSPKAFSRISLGKGWEKVSMHTFMSSF